MEKDNAAMIDKALDMLMGDMDELEGKGALSHTQEECTDPLTCTQHDGEASKSLAEDGKPALEISIKGMPTLDGAKAEDAKAEDGLSTEEQDELRKLLKA